MDLDCLDEDNDKLQSYIDETSQVSALDLYEDLLVNDAENGQCLSIQEVNLEKQQLQEQNRLLSQQLTQATISLNNKTEQNRVLKENFTSLLETAKIELERKNKVIARLSGGSGQLQIPPRKTFQSNKNAKRNPSSKSVSLKGRRIDDVIPAKKSESLEEKVSNTATNATLPNTMNNISPEAVPSQSTSKTRTVIRNELKLDEGNQNISENVQKSKPASAHQSLETAPWKDRRLRSSSNDALHRENNARKSSGCEGNDTNLNRRHSSKQPNRHRCNKEKFADQNNSIKSCMNDDNLPSVNKAVAGSTENINPHTHDARLSHDVEPGSFDTQRINHERQSTNRKHSPAFEKKLPSTDDKNGQCVKQKKQEILLKPRHRDDKQLESSSKKSHQHSEDRSRRSEREQKEGRRDPRPDQRRRESSRRSRASPDRYKPDSHSSRGRSIDDRDQPHRRSHEPSNTRNRHNRQPTKESGSSLTEPRERRRDRTRMSSGGVSNPSAQKESSNPKGISPIKFPDQAETLSQIDSNKPAFSTVTSEDVSIEIFRATETLKRKADSSTDMPDKKILRSLSGRNLQSSNNTNSQPNSAICVRSVKEADKLLQALSESKHAVKPHPVKSVESGKSQNGEREKPDKTPVIQTPLLTIGSPKSGAKSASTPSANNDKMISAKSAKDLLLVSPHKLKNNAHGDMLDIYDQLDYDEDSIQATIHHMGIEVVDQSEPRRRLSAEHLSKLPPTNAHSSVKMDDITSRGKQSTCLSKTPSPLSPMHNLKAEVRLTGKNLEQALPLSQHNKCDDEKGFNSVDKTDHALVKSAKTSSKFDKRMTSPKHNTLTRTANRKKMESIATTQSKLQCEKDTKSLKAKKPTAVNDNLSLPVPLFSGKSIDPPSVQNTSIMDIGSEVVVECSTPESSRGTWPQYEVEQSVTKTIGVPFQDKTVAINISSVKPVEREVVNSKRIILDSNLAQEAKSLSKKSPKKHKLENKRQSSAANEDRKEVSGLNLNCPSGQSKASMSTSKTNLATSTLPVIDLNTANTAIEPVSTTMLSESNFPRKTDETERDNADTKLENIVADIPTQDLSMLKSVDESCYKVMTPPKSEFEPSCNEKNLKPQGKLKKKKASSKCYLSVETVALRRSPRRPRPKFVQSSKINENKGVKAKRGKKPKRHSRQLYISSDPESCDDVPDLNVKEVKTNMAGLNKSDFKNKDIPPSNKVTGKESSNDNLSLSNPTPNPNPDLASVVTTSHERSDSPSIPNLAQPKSKMKQKRNNDNVKKHKQKKRENTPVGDSNQSHNNQSLAKEDECITVQRNKMESGTSNESSKISDVDIGQSFMNFYRNASLQYLIHLAKERLAKQRSASSSVRKEQVKNTGQPLARQEGQDAQEITNTQTKKNKDARQLWMTSLEECQHRRRLRSRWMSERSDEEDDIPTQAQDTSPKCLCDRVTYDAPVSIGDFVSMPSLHASSCSWAINEESLQNFLSIVKAVTPIKSIRKSDRNFPSSDDDSWEENEKLLTVRKKVLQTPKKHF
ncbi:unnamed protein product [Clavelina lepadiformis]|uniref:Uncharacterized protein n=1 Tax=Clavelina lepadiformis TaxID=159417 RepID=A0ABP0FKK1_CLALP